MPDSSKSPQSSNKGALDANTETDTMGLGYETSGSEVQVLEPRVLLDAAGFVTAHDAMDAALSVETNNGVNAVFQGEISAPWFVDKTLNEQELFATAPQATSITTEIVFIDAQVEDIDRFTASLDESVQVYILNADEDGVEQIDWCAWR